MYEKLKKGGYNKAMIEIAAVENDNIDAENLKNCLKEYFSTEYKTQYNLSLYEDAESFLEDYNDQFDLIFMDIDLKEINGINAAKTIRNRNKNVAIVFLTNLSHFAMNGWEVNALDYILKPITQYTFNLRMPKIIHYMQVNNEKQITISNKTMIQRLYVSDIYYIEVLKHDLIYHTKLGTFTTRGTMKAAEAEMEQYQFFKCNNCFLVNLRYVSGIKDNTVTVGSNVLTISRTRKADFINQLTDYIGGKL